MKNVLILFWNLFIFLCLIRFLRVFSQMCIFPMKIIEANMLNDQKKNKIDKQTNM